MTCRIRYSPLPNNLSHHASRIQYRYPRLAEHLLNVSKAIAAAEQGVDEKDVMEKLGGLDA
jgi:hypothetical protein